MHASLCDQLVDLVQNSLEAGAKRVVVRVDESFDNLIIEVQDDGCGMSEGVLARALDPFYTDGRKHRHRKVGLGLAFLKQMTDATGGRLLIESQPGEGTKISCRLDRGHPDVPPSGNWVETFANLMAFDADYDLLIERRFGKSMSYHISRNELKEALGELQTAGSLKLAREYIASHEEALQKGMENGTIDA